MARRLRHPIAKHHASPEPLAVNSDEERSASLITVRITRYGSKLLDPDNLCGGVKPLLDAIRYERLIPDDSPDQIELIVRQKKTMPCFTGTLIEIETHDRPSNTTQTRNVSTEANPAPQGLKEASERRT